MQAQLQQAGQVVQQLQQRLTDKSDELDLKARDLDIKEKKVDLDAQLKAEELAMRDVDNAQNDIRGRNDSFTRS